MVHISYLDSEPEGWKGKSRTGKWDKVVSAAASLDLDKFICVKLDNADECRRAQSALHTYISKHSPGFRYNTSIKENEMLVQKVLP